MPTEAILAESCKAKYVEEDGEISVAAGPAAQGTMLRRGGPLPTASPEGVGVVGGGQGALERQAERIAERYAPAYVLVDPRLEALSFSGRMGRFLEPASGAANLNILHLVHHDLRDGLRDALQRSAAGRAVVKLEGASLDAGDGAGPRGVDMVVEPLPGEAPAGFVILFRDAGSGAPAAAPGEPDGRLEALRRDKAELGSLLDATQIATLYLDNDLAVRRFTPAACEVFELAATDVGRPLGRIASRIDYPELETDVRRVLRTLSGMERLVEVRGGGCRHVRVLPYRNAENYLAGAVLTFLDVTEAVRAQAELKKSEADFRAVAELVPELLWRSDCQGEVDWCNQRWVDYTGRSPPGTPGWAWVDAVHPDEREAVRRAFRQAAQDERPFRREHRMRSAEGEYRWFLVDAAPVRADDDCVRYYGAATDIDDLKRSGDRHRLLLAELQHRVKNILAVVRSISARSLDTADDLQSFAAHFSGRLDALARTQGVIARRGHDGVELEELVLDELAASSSRDGAQVDISGPRVVLKEKAAEVFALALHELATNAVKYGALSASQGRVSVDWRVMNTSAGRRLSLHWRESGVRALDSRPTRVGFGRDLIEHGLPYDLGATTSLEFAPGGVRCSVELPLSDRVLEVEEVRLDEPDDAGEPG